MSSESPLEVANETASSTPEAAVENTAATATKPSVSFDALERKMELQGVVLKVELQGALVDVGSEKNGLLHISQLSSDPVKNVMDVVKVGDTVTVYVLAVDKKKGRLDLTMIKPTAEGWDDLKVNNNYTGTVVRIEKFGVFVDIGAERPGLIHVSELATGFVPDPAQVVKIGDAIEAKLIGVNRRKKQIDLSVKALEQQQLREIEQEVADEDEEELPTAMALALRRAMGSDDEDFPLPPPSSSSSQNKKRNKKKRTAEQEDIIARTLRMHGN